MNIEIEIVEPFFKCRDDEEIFFQRLAEIKGIRKIVNQGSGVSVTVSGEEQQDVVNEVAEISDIWNTSYTLVR